MNGCLFFDSESTPIKSNNPPIDLGTPNDVTIGEDLGVNEDLRPGLDVQDPNEDLGMAIEDMGPEVYENPEQCVENDCWFVEISAGSNHSCAIRKSGELLYWGSNKDAQRTNTYNQSTPPNGTFKYVSAGLFQLCHPNRPLHCVLADYKSIATGRDKACAIRKGAPVTDCWGKEPGSNFNNALDSFTMGNKFECGLDDITICTGSLNIVTDNVPIDPFSKIAAGAKHVCGIVQDGTIKCWGENRQARLQSPN